jgi:hypothetical protein
MGSGRRSGGGTQAQTGALNAKAVPSRETGIRMTYGCTRCNQEKIASNPAADASHR